MSQALTDTIIISDDRQFLNLLAAQSIPFLSPTDMVLTMANQGVLTTEKAKGAVNLLKPLISPAECQRAIAMLEQR